MNKLLVFSYSGFSDQNANGKTLKSLLSAWNPDQLMQIYAGDQKPDFKFCYHYFHVTDSHVLKACLGRKSVHCPSAVPASPESPLSGKTASLPQSGFAAFVRKHKYNYFFRTMREFLWILSPWGQRELLDCIRKFQPDAVFYMVGDSFAFDHILRKILKAFPVPLVLYNAEAYRIIDLSTRKGLEHYYCRKAEISYGKLCNRSALILYNSSYLREHYCRKYGATVPSDTVYLSDFFDTSPYRNTDTAKKIAYFGNLGVGRIDSLIDIANALHAIDPSLTLDVYGNASPENITKLDDHKTICYHGLVGQDTLHQVKEGADILIQAESFDPEIMPKLKFAFSTKIGQYLCAGRCIFSYAPEDMAATQYLLQNNCAIIATEYSQLEEKLRLAVNDGATRTYYAEQALITAKKNHNLSTTADKVLHQIYEIIPDSEADCT